MMNFDKICRVCMRSEPNLEQIFGEESAVGIAEMLIECSPCKVDRCDALPQQICVACLVSLRSAYNFRQNCEKSHRHMINILGNCFKDEGAEDCDLVFDHCIRAEKQTQTDAKEFDPCKRSSSVEKDNALVYEAFSDEDVAQHINEEIKIDEFKCEFEIEETEDAEDTEEQLLNPIDPIQTNLLNEEHKPDIEHFDLKDEDTIDTIGENDDALLSSDNDPIYEPNCEESQSSSNSTSCVNEKKAKSTKTSAHEFTCKDCQKTYANETQYKRHRTTRHNFKEHTCNYCEKSFCRRIYLVRHMRAHDEKRFTCRDCSQNFITKDELEVHHKSEGHGHPPMLLCPECGLRCKSSSNLRVHMRRHNGERPYKCKFCSKGFPRSDDLKVHEKYHTGEKSHFCDTCGKGFQRKYNLTLHLRVHTGEKPHKCPHCPQAFSQKHDLKLHIRRHTGERLRCEFCDAAFLQGYQMRQHKLNEHGIKEAPPNQRVAKFTSPEQQAQQIQEQIQKRQSN